MQKLTQIQKQLVEKNHNLIYGFAHKYKLKVDEYYDILALALCQAAMQYCKDKSQFPTFAYICMTNAIRNYIKSENKNVIPLIYLDADYTDSTSDDENLLNVITNNNLQLDIEVEGKQISQILFSMLSDKEKQIVIDRVNGLSEKQIAIKMGCTHQNIHDWIKRIRAKWNIFYSKDTTAIR